MPLGHVFPTTAVFLLAACGVVLVGYFVIRTLAGLWASRSQLVLSVAL